MHVLATAGHVDHGKSTLVRALTGMETDRWEAERRRGLTIDLGYAWTTLPSGERLALVDVPGHRRFIGNMLAGVGPVPAVLFVVAADGGWSAQSDEHLRAVQALGIERGLLVVTRADLADPGPALATARERLSGGSLAGCETLAVSAVTGAGMARLRGALDDLVATMPAPEPTSRLRLWVDRSFTMAGAGTVVTGTLGAGSIAVGDEVEVAGRRVRVRGLQALEERRDRVQAPARVAVNLRGVGADAVGRGDAVLTPGAWRATSTIDARFVGDPQSVPKLPPRVTLHLGTASQVVHLRPLDTDATGAVRVALRVPLPIVAGDRAILRDPGDASGAAVAGIVVVDADPPALTRRGDGSRRGHHLADREAGRLDLATEVAARGAMRSSHATDLGLDPASQAAPLVRHEGWLVDPEQWRRWGVALRELAAARAVAHPLDPYLPLEAARAQVGLPELRLVAAAAADAGLQVTQGRVHLPGARPDLGAAEAGLRRIEERLTGNPFAAPEAHDLQAAGLGTRQLAAAVATGRLLRLHEGVYLQPLAPAHAMRLLAALPQPFTTSQARQALATTRRVAIPLLEHLDGRGWTRRLDAGHREIARG